MLYYVLHQGWQPVITAGHSDTSVLVNCHKERLNWNINMFHVLILRCNKDSTRHVGYIRGPQGVTAALNSSGSVQSLVTDSRKDNEASVFTDKITEHSSNS